MKVDKEWLEVVLRKWEADQGVARVLSAEVAPAVGKGENYGSEMLRASLKIITGKGEIKPRRLVVKRNHGQTDAEGNRLFDTLFFAEIRMYQTYLPKIEAMLKSVDYLTEKMWPTCYGNSEDNVQLVFEDLKEENYSLAVRQSGLDLAHATLVIVGLARLHATSRAGLTAGILDPFGLPPYPMAGKNPAGVKFIKVGMEAIHDVLNELKPDRSSTAKKLLECGETLCQDLAVLLEATPELMRVINHGDTWVNNIMFKYDHDGVTPTNCRFVDFQLSHVGSLGCDLAYFLYTSLMPSVREPNYQQLLEAYCGEFEACLKALGRTDLRVPTTDEVKAELNRLSLVSLFACCNVLPIIMNKQDAAVINVTEMTSQKESLKSYYHNPDFVDAVCEDLDILKLAGCYILH